MAGVDDHSEYEGGGVMPNTVFPMGQDALSAGDELRLDSLTGQHVDSRAPLDPYHWHGNLRYDPRKEEADARGRIERQRQIRREEAARYRESPY